MVIPCSRSARRPSAESREVDGGIAGDGADVVVVDVVRIVEQAADERGLAVVNAAVVEEAQKIFSSFSLRGALRWEAPVRKLG